MFSGGVGRKPGKLDPAHPAVLRFKQGCRLHSGIEDARLGIAPWLNVPEPVNRLPAAWYSVRPDMTGEAGLLPGLFPGMAQVAADFNLWPPNHVVGSGEERTTIPVSLTVIVDQVENIAARAVGAGEAPILAVGVAVENKCALAGAYHQEDVSSRRLNALGDGISLLRDYWLKAGQSRAILDSAPTSLAVTESELPCPGCPDLTDVDGLLQPQPWATPDLLPA